MLEACVIELFLHDAFTDSSDRAPDDPGEGGNAGLVRPGDQPCDEVLKVLGEHRVGARGGHGLGPNPVVVAARPPAQYFQDQGAASQIQVPPRGYSPADRIRPCWLRGSAGRKASSGL